MCVILVKFVIYFIWLNFQGMHIRQTIDCGSISIDIWRQLYIVVNSNPCISVCEFYICIHPTLYIRV
jgi:hypothetical protein